VKYGTRLFLGAAGILTLTTVSLLLVASRWIRHEMENALAHDLELEAHLVGTVVSGRTEEWNLVAHHLGTTVGRRVTIVDTAGNVLGDSDFDDASLQLLDNHASRPEIAAALAGSTGRARRYSESTGRMEVKVAVRAWPGVIRVSAPVAAISETIRRVQIGILVAATLALAGGLLLAILGARAVAQPVKALARAAQAVAVGGSPSLPASDVPELRELTRAFKAMHDEVENRIAELRRERGEMETLLASTAEGIIAANDRGDITVCNEAARRLLGFGSGAALPALRELFHQRDVRELVEEILLGRSVLGREVSVSGKEILITARPLPAGGAVLGLLDITELKRLEMVRRDFVANVSHELKTPLTSIVGYTETLLTDRPDAATTRQFLTTLHANARRMQRLVDDLLDLARLESGTWEPHRAVVAVADIAREAWDACAQRADGRRLRFEITAPEGLQVQADREALRQVFSNLLDNALRYTPDEGSIRVMAEPAPNAVMIAVSDTGSGIPSEHVERVFERFYRVDPARSREEGGTGLGLSIVKHIVEAHGGSVTIESTLGEGTTVRMVLPELPGA
jgi:two-component system phosphate regulon sensor histidine kinase PhoR